MVRGRLPPSLLSLQFYVYLGKLAVIPSTA